MTCRQHTERINDVRKGIVNLNLRSQPLKATVSAHKIAKLLLNIAILSTDLNYWIKHPFEFSDPILKPEY